MAYSNLFARLVANTAEPENEQACWVWNSKVKCRYGYGRFAVRVSHLQHPVLLSAHVAAWVLTEIGTDASNDDLFWACQELVYSKLELDHTCVNTSCINPDHLDLCTHLENIQRKFRR